MARLFHGDRGSPVRPAATSRAATVVAATLGHPGRPRQPRDRGDHLSSSLVSTARLQCWGRRPLWLAAAADQRQAGRGSSGKRLSRQAEAGIAPRALPHRVLAVRPEDLHAAASQDSRDRHGRAVRPDLARVPKHAIVPVWRGGRCAPARCRWLGTAERCGPPCRTMCPRRALVDAATW